MIAIENVRLFKELETRNRDLTEALEQQTATSEILRVISQSQTDVQPVFDTIATAALKLCGAASANVFTFDGELIHLAASSTRRPSGVEAMRRVCPRPPSRDTAAGRARSDVQRGHDPGRARGSGLRIAPRPRSRPGFAASSPFRSCAKESRSAPSRSAGPSPGPFPDTQIALLQTFADQAVIAIENVRLFKELEARTDAADAVGRGAQGAGRRRPGGQFDAGSRDRAVHHRLARHAARRAWTAAPIYEYDESTRGVLPAHGGSPARRPGRGTPGRADPQG